MKNKKSLLCMFKAGPFWTVLIVAMNVVFVITACSGAAVQTTIPATQPPATQAPTQTTEAPTATLTPKPMVTGPGGFPVGTYKPDHKLWASYMLLTAQGTVVIGLGDADTGSYTVNGDQIVFNMDIGVCHNHPGIYHWEMHGNTLTLKPINDTCTDSSRQEDMEGRSWILQP